MPGAKPRRQPLRASASIRMRVAAIGLTPPSCHCARSRTRPERPDPRPALRTWWPKACHATNRPVASRSARGFTAPLTCRPPAEHVTQAVALLDTVAATNPNAHTNVLALQVTLLWLDVRNGQAQQRVVGALRDDPWNRMANSCSKPPRPGFTPLGPLKKARLPDGGRAGGSGRRRTVFRRAGPCAWPTSAALSRGIHAMPPGPT